MFDVMSIVDAYTGTFLVDKGVGNESLFLPYIYVEIYARKKVER